MPKTESTHAAYLRENGFTIIPTSRESRRLKRKSPPSFTSVEGLTYATDDTGETWLVSGTRDLSKHGFNNMSARARVMLEAAGLAKKTN